MANTIATGAAPESQLVLGMPAADMRLPRELARRLELLRGVTLEALPFYDRVFDVTTQGWEIEAEFEGSPQLPGAIVRSGEEIVGIISKRHFRYCMSQPYSIELYLRWPISRFLGTFGSKILYLRNDCRIGHAVRKALARDPEELYDPIAVKYPDKTVKLIDFHDLLLAQNQLLVQYSAQLDAEKDRSQRHIDDLHAAREESRRYAAQLEGDKKEAQARNRQLEEQQEALSKQKAEILRQSEEITALNQKFMQLGKFLSCEGSKAFETMFLRAETISAHMKEIIATGKNLHHGVSSITDAASLIERLRQSVQDLVVRFSQVSSGPDGADNANWNGLQAEIVGIGGKTFEASSYVGRIGATFKAQIQELTSAAISSEEEVQSLFEDSQRTRAALDELEAIVSNRNGSSL